MTARFADTSYFLALVNPQDEAYAQAVEQTRAAAEVVVTTSAVLNELANHLSSPLNRPLFLETLARLRRNPAATIVHVDAELFERGIQLYRARSDKSWSLTDCVSFIVME